MESGPGLGLDFSDRGKYGHRECHCNGGSMHINIYAGIIAPYIHLLRCIYMVSGHPSFSSRFFRHEAGT